MTILNPDATTSDLPWEESPAEREHSYRGLARHFLDEQNPWLAVHAQLAADLQAAAIVTGTPVDDLLAASADQAPSEEQILTAWADLQPVDAEYAVDAVRSVLWGMIPPAQRHTWRERLVPADCYAGLSADPADQIAWADQHLGGCTIESSALSGWEAAENLLNDARARAADGDAHGSADALAASDWAAFWAWNMDRAAVTGDSLLVQARIRAALADRAISDLEVVTVSSLADVAEVARVRRARLCWALGPFEGRVFARRMAAAGTLGN